MCVRKCVIKLININKYKQTRDDMTCEIKVEVEIDVHGDVQNKREASDKFVPLFSTCVALFY